MGNEDDYAAPAGAFTVRLGRELLRRATTADLSRGRRPCLARWRVLVSVIAITSIVGHEYNQVNTVHLQPGKSEDW